MNRPWSRYSRALRLCSSWSSSLSSLPRTIRMTGHTDLHNKYRINYQSKPPRGGCAGEYTTKRTARTLLAVAKVHARVATGEWVYLITHTMSDAADEKLRRRMFRKVLDRVRKLKDYAGHMWTTERHKSGQLHHHLCLRMYSYWDYSRVIKSWSMRYTGSVNGLDVSTPPGIGESRAVNYAAKAFFYAVKRGPSGDKLPFRWWGTSKIARKFRCADDDLPVLFTAASSNSWPKCAMVPRQWAVVGCAKFTERYEWARRCHRMRTLRRRDKHPPGRMTDEQLLVPVPRGTHNPPGHRGCSSPEQAV